MEKINLTGKWIVVRWEIRTADDQWQNALKRPYSENDLWIFGSTHETHDKLQGKLICAFGDSGISFNKFTYFMEDAKLYVEDPSEDSRDDLYRVVRQNDTMIILYSLEDIRNETEGYRLRVVLKKFVCEGQ